MQLAEAGGAPDVDDDFRIGAGIAIAGTQPGCLQNDGFRRRAGDKDRRARDHLDVQQYLAGKGAGLELVVFRRFAADNDFDGGGEPEMTADLEQFDGAEVLELSIAAKVMDPAGEMGFRQFAAACRRGIFRDPVLFSQFLLRLPAPAIQVQ